MTTYQILCDKCGKHIATLSHQPKKPTIHLQCPKGEPRENTNQELADVPRAFIVGFSSNKSSRLVGTNEDG